MSLIKNLKPAMKNLEIFGTVIKIENISTSYRTLAKAIIQDDSGKIILNLWGDQVNQCKIGDTIKITNAYTRSRFRILELNTWEKIQVINSNKG